MSQLRRKLMMGNQGDPSLRPKFYKYLVFDGTAYIETDYVLPENCSVAVQLGNETLQAAQRVFMAISPSDGNNGKFGVLIGGATDTTRRQIVPYNDTTTYVASGRYINWTNPSWGFFMTPYRYGWGNTGFNYTKGSAHPTGHLFFGTWEGSSSVSNYTGTMDTFYVIIDITGTTGANNYTQVVSHTPVATFKPCMYQGEAGLWLVEEKKFYGNSAGAGTLSVTNTIS